MTSRIRASFERPVLWRVAPSVFLAAGSICLGRVVSAESAQQGLAFGVMGGMCLLLWLQLERVQRAGRRLRAEV